MRSVLVAALAALSLAAAAAAAAGPDYYKLLGVPRSVDAKALKRAYRKLSLKHHPDKNSGDAESSRLFAEINVAYEVLSDKKTRSIYDRGGEEGIKKHKKNEAGGGGGGFHSFFGRRRAQPGEQTGPDIRLDLPVTLRDIYVGVEVPVRVRGTHLCSHCRGSGAHSDEDVKVCGRCGGKGHTVERRQVAPGFVQQVQRQCPACGGKGRQVRRVCGKCGGRKVEAGSRVVDVSVERGVPDGEELVYENQADESPDHIAGNLVFRVRTVEDPLFTRNGNDLRMRMRLSLREALLGFAREVPHLDGHLFEVRRAGVTPHGQTHLVRGEGMPHHNAASTRGDLVVEFDVRFPETLTAEQQRLLRQALA